MTTILPDLQRYERQARARGVRTIAGIDEAGRGPLAGPVVAAACILPEDCAIAGIDDSKKLTPKRRDELFAKLTNDDDVLYSVAVVDADIVDSINIYQATIKAMLQAVEGLDELPDCLFVDGMALPHPSIPVLKIVKGDSLSISIAAASIIAKVTRDRIMLDYHARWPQYHFDKHKGYGTQTHLRAIATFGTCSIHRRTFKGTEGT